MMNSFIRKIGMTIVVAATGVALTACGKNASNIFSNLQFSTSMVGTDEYANLEVDVTSTNVTLPATTLPITVNGKNVGTVTVGTDATTNKSDLTVDLDLTAALSLPPATLDENLPNGMAWPLTGVDLSKMVSLDLGQAGSKVYVLQDATTKETLIGLAINIDNLNIGSSAGIFTPFTSNKVTGVTGLYFSTAAKSSGVAFLANLSQAMGATKSSAIKINNPKLSDDTAGKIWQRVFDMQRDHEVIRLK